MFAALDEVRGVQALCPTWLPDAVQPAMIYVSDEPQYVVEFHPLNGLFPHVVLELSLGDPPGHRLRETTVRGMGATVHFNPPNNPNQQAGLHSGHYIVAFPGGDCSGSLAAYARCGKPTTARGHHEWRRIQGLG